MLFFFLLHAATGRWILQKTIHWKTTYFKPYLNCFLKDTVWFRILGIVFFLCFKQYLFKPFFFFCGTERIWFGSSQLWAHYPKPSLQPNQHIQDAHLQHPSPCASFPQDGTVVHCGCGPRQRPEGTKPGCDWAAPSPALVLAAVVPVFAFCIVPFFSHMLKSSFCSISSN